MSEAEIFAMGLGFGLFFGFVVGVVSHVAYRMSKDAGNDNA